MANKEVKSFFYDFQLTLDKVLDYAVTAFPNNEIVYWPPGGSRTSVTFSQLADRARSVAAALMDLDLRPGKAWELGSRVAVLEWNTLRYLDLYYAVPGIGAVLFTVNALLAPKEIIYTMGVAKPEVFIVNIDYFEPLLKPVIDNVKSIRTVVYMSDRGRQPGQDYGVRMIPYEDLLRHEPLREFPEIDERTPATMLFTSGTTGMPKGGYHTHRGLVLHTLSTALSIKNPPMNVTQEDVAMFFVPMYHVHAWGYPWSTMLNGHRKIVYPGRYDWGHILKLIHEEGVTFSAGVPTILYNLLNHPDSPKYDLSRLKFVIGGAALPEGLLKAAQARGMTVISGYGLTETAPVLTIAHLRPEHRDLPPEKKNEIYMRTGIVIPLVQLRVVDEQDNDVPKDGKTIGEIAVRAPWLFREYIGDPEKTRNAWRNGWFHTGDAAVWLPDNYVKIADRLKDVIKSGGEWIPSLRLEDLISTHPGVNLVAVVGIPHEKWGERPVAIVVPKPGYEGRLTEDDIKSYLMQFVDKGEIPKWWIPDRVIFVKELPLTSTGKIDKKVLRDQFKTALSK